MGGISRTPSFPCSLAVAITIFIMCVFPIVQAQDGSSSNLRLPSESSNEGQNLCAGTVPASCPVTCFRTDPVCGVDGVTYWCGCAEAACAGTKVAKSGFCEVGSGSSVSLPGQALLLVHIVWLIVLAFSVLFGLFWLLTEDIFEDLVRYVIVWSIHSPFGNLLFGLASCARVDLYAPEEFRDFDFLSIEILL